MYLSILFTCDIVDWADIDAFTEPRLYPVTGRLLAPLIAALVMAVSVVSNALRLKRKEL